MRNEQTDDSETSSTQQLPAVSVIIAARNASKELKGNLPTVLNQIYPTYEVIIIDDGSDDDTLAWLSQHTAEYDNLRVISYQKAGPGKKEALSHGIHQARYDIILVTDADCRPDSKHWIREMTVTLGSQHQIVFGYGPYRKIIGLLNKFIRFDTATIAIQYLSAVGQGHPYMGVGRNMIYRREIFIDNGGFDDHKDIASGDDDLFIQGLPDDISADQCITSESLVYSEPKKTWRSFIQQKSRHITTSVRYKWRDKLRLIIYPVMHVSFYVMLGWLAWHEPYVAGLIYLGRVLWLTINLSRAMRQLKEQDLIPWLWLLDVVQVPYYMIITFNAAVRKKSKW